MSLKRTPDDDEIPSMAALNGQQRKFVRELIHNGGQKGLAALAAGYGGTGPTRVECAAVTASRLCDNPKVQAAVKDLCRAVLGTDGLTVGVLALKEIAGDPTHKARHTAAAKLIDLSFPPTSKVEVEHTRTHDDDMLERAKELSLREGIPIENMVGRNRIDRSFDGFLQQWNARWGHETDTERFERLARLVAQWGERYASTILGPYLTDAQKARLQEVLHDPRHTLNGLPLLIEGTAVSNSVSDAEHDAMVASIMGPSNAA